MQTPTPVTRQALTHQQCQDLISQYNPNRFSYVPPECQEMFRAYQNYLKQKDLEAELERQQAAAAARARQQQDTDSRARDEAIQRNIQERLERERRQNAEKWFNDIQGILRRKRP